MERACANAAELARRLAGHPAVHRVRHPSLPSDPGHARAAEQMGGFGAVIGLEVRGGPGAAELVARGVWLWVHATSLGGVESTLERRRRHPAESPACPESLLRLSVGIEDVEDLWADLRRRAAPVLPEVVGGRTGLTTRRLSRRAHSSSVLRGGTAAGAPLGHGQPVVPPPPPPAR